MAGLVIIAGIWMSQKAACSELANENAALALRISNFEKTIIEKDQDLKLYKKSILLLIMGYKDTPIDHLPLSTFLN